MYKVVVIKNYHMNSDANCASVMHVLKFFILYLTIPINKPYKRQL